MRKDQEKYPDKYNSGNERKDEQNVMSNVAYPWEVGIFFTREGFLATLLALLLVWG